MQDYLTLDDLAKRWGVSNDSVRARKSRGRLPEPDRIFGKSPVWLPETIESYERGRDGSDETG